jgi:hypothetical protein
MAQITLNIPENQLSFFMELAKKLGFEVESKTESINEWQKSAVKKRRDELMKDSTKTVDFDEMSIRLEKKYGL